MLGSFWHIGGRFVSHTSLFIVCCSSCFLLYVYAHVCDLCLFFSLWSFVVCTALKHLCTSFFPLKCLLFLSVLEMKHHTLMWFFLKSFYDIKIIKMNASFIYYVKQSDSHFLGFVLEDNCESLMLIITQIIILKSGNWSISSDRNKEW